MKSLSRAAAIAAMLTATLAACDGGSTGDGTRPEPGVETSTSPLSAEPADGSAISHDDFSYSVPDGWEESEQSRAASLAIDAEDEDGFIDNMFVVIDNTLAELEGADLEDAAEQILADGSATHITTRESVQIDGEDAVHTSAVFELSDPKHRVEQYAVVHDETGYIITVSFSPDVPAARRAEVSESILTTWKWDS